MSIVPSDARWYVVRAKQSIGPLTLEGVQKGLDAGTIGLKDELVSVSVAHRQPVASIIVPTAIDKIDQEVRSMWTVAGSDKSKWMEIEGELMIAIKNCGGFAPRHHCRLASVYSNLEDMAKCKRSIQTALGQDQWLFEAVLFQAAIELEHSGLKAPIAKSFLKSSAGQGFEGFAFGVSLGLTVGLFEALFSLGRTQNFKRLVEKVGEAYLQDIGVFDNPANWIQSTEMVLAFQDVLGKSNTLLAKTVFNYPLNATRATVGELATIRELRRRAERRLAAAGK